jgi:hypothetical protein
LINLKNELENKNILLLPFTDEDEINMKKLDKLKQKIIEEELNIDNNPNRGTKNLNKLKNKQALVKKNSVLLTKNVEISDKYPALLEGKLWLLRLFEQIIKLTEINSSNVTTAYIKTWCFTYKKLISLYKLLSETLKTGFNNSSWIE